MAAYMIAHVKKIHDQDAYAEYRKMVPSSVEKYGGRFIVRGGAVEVAEGDWQPGRLVVIEFPDVATARAWLDSEEYAPARKLRMDNADADLIVVEGV